MGFGILVVETEPRKKKKKKVSTPHLGMASNSLPLLSSVKKKEHFSIFAFVFGAFSLLLPHTQLVQESFLPTTPFHFSNPLILIPQSSL